MMDELENSSVDIEQLLRSKSWQQLSGTEQAEVLKLVSGREEYEQLYAITHQLKTTAGVHDADMKPSRAVRENLLAAFDAEQKKRKAAWWTNILYFLNERIRFDIPVVRLAVASVLLIGVVFGAIKLSNTDGSQPAIVKQENHHPVVPDPGSPDPVQPNEQPQVTPPQPQNNNIVEENSNGVAPLNNQPQMMQSLPPVAPDTTANRLALVVPDSALMPALTFGNTNALCCGTSNGTVLPNATSGVSYSWAPVTNNVTIITNGLPSRSRSLAEDAAVMDVFFAVK